MASLLIPLLEVSPASVVTQKQSERVRKELQQPENSMNDPGSWSSCNSSLSILTANFLDNVIDRILTKTQETKKYISRNISTSVITAID